MPETRHNLIVEITDPDRLIDMQLVIEFDVNGSGGVEHPEVTEILSGRMWLGKRAFNFDVIDASPDASKGIMRFIGSTYEAEIREAILGERERERWADV